MEAKVRPIIVEKLQAFARRRRRLVMIRAGMASMTTLFVGMVLVAGLDWGIFLPDGVRYLLSAVVYGAAMVVAWRLGIAQLVAAPDARQMARLFEHAEPTLREDLISAVELGVGGTEVFDSVEFRELLQSDVASRMEGLEVDALLPMELIQRYTKWGMGIVGGVLCLMFVSGFQMSSLFLRALLPGANLERVASTRVEIVEPKPGDQRVAYGDSVRVEIRLVGEKAKVAKLEMERKGGGRMVAEMTALGEGRFTTTVLIGRESVKYRVQAGDGLSRRYELSAVDRPHETAFRKTYRSPEYAGIGDKTVEEASGNLVGLEGGEVELTISTNQRVKRGELRIDQGKEGRVIPLVRLADGRLSGRVKLDSPGSYRVYLVGAETGFENRFSPEYEIRTVVDGAPSVVLEAPEKDLISPASELIKVVGRASDDIGLARVVQKVRINDGEWKEKSFGVVKGLSAKVERDWDLALEGVKSGDLIASKLLVTDLKGRTAESRTIQVMVVADLEMKRMGGLAKRERLQKALKALAKAGETFGEAAGRLHWLVDLPGVEVGVKKEAMEEFARASGEFEAKLSAGWVALNEPLREGMANHESADLVLLGQLLSEANGGALRVAGKAFEYFQVSEGKVAKSEWIGVVDEGVERASALATLAERISGWEFSGEQIDRTMELGLLLGAEHARIRGLGLVSQTPGDWARVGARLQSLLGVTKTLDEALESIRRGGGALAANAETALQRKFFLWTREATAAELVSEKPGAQLFESFRDFSKFFGIVMQDMANARGRLAVMTMEAGLMGRKNARGWKPVGADHFAGMEYLGRMEEEKGWEAVERLRREWMGLAKGGGVRSAENRRGILEARWAGVGDLFKARADLEEVRAVADNDWVGDLRKSTVALPTVLVLARGDGVEKTAGRLETMVESLKILEVGHGLQELIDGLVGLVEVERWELQVPHARTSAPRDWAWLATRLQMAPEEMGRVNLRDEGGKKALRLAGLVLEQTTGSVAFGAVSVEMVERKKLGYGLKSARGPLEEVVKRVRVALGMLRGRMEEARKNLAELTPSVSELAMALAKEEEGLKKEGEEFLGKMAVGKLEENQRMGLGEVGVQGEINQRIEALKDLIRAQANSANILNKEDRERVRDADDALALLKILPPMVLGALRKVTTEGSVSGQGVALKSALVEEQKLILALKRIAGYFEAVEEDGKVEEAREELREVEEELGVKEELEEQEAKAEELAELAAKTPEQLLAELESKLATHPEMRKELKKIKEDALANAKVELERAAKAEAKATEKVAEQAEKDRQATAPEAVEQKADVAQDQASVEIPEGAVQNPKLAPAAVDQKTVKQDAKDAAADLKRAERHAERLEQKEAKEKLGDLAAQVAKTAEKEVATADKALQEASTAAGAESPLAAASAELARELAELNGAGQDGASPGDSAGEGSMPGGAPGSSPGEEQGLARLLDALDQQVNGAGGEGSMPGAGGEGGEGSMPGGGEGGQGGEGGKGEGGQGGEGGKGEGGQGGEGGKGEGGQGGEGGKGERGQGGEGGKGEGGQGGEGGKGGEGGQAGKGGKGDALGALARAAMSAQRQGRASKSASLPGAPGRFSLQAKSQGGAKFQGVAQSSGALPELPTLQSGVWGMLRKQSAEDLTSGRGDDIPANYREAIETYYRVVAERAQLK